MDNEAVVLKDQLSKINQKLNGVMDKANQRKIRDSAIMLNEILKDIDEVYVIIENIYGVNNSLVHEINSRVEKVIVAYEKNNPILIKLNLQQLKNVISEINMESNSGD